MTYLTQTFLLLAHRAMTLRCGIWPPSGHGGHRQSRTDQTRFASTRAGEFACTSTPDRTGAGGPDQAASIMRGEAAVPSLRGQSRELPAAQMDERGVIAALHIDFALRFDAVVDDDVEAVALANRRNRPTCAVAEQLRDLVFA